MAYVEFESRDNINPALQLQGLPIRGYPAAINYTPTEKVMQLPHNQEPATRLHVSNLLPTITEKDLSPVINLN